MALSAVHASNDEPHTTVLDATGVATDGIGGLRQISAITQVSSQLAQGAAIISGVASTILAIGLCLTGTLCMVLAGRWTIPMSYAKLKASIQELKDAKNPEAIQEAKKAIEIARLSLANHSLLFVMGVAQSASGIVDMLSPTVAHTLHYSPLLTGAAAKVASTASTIALGVVYIVRGSVLMARAVKSYLLVRDFENDLKEKKTLKDAMNFMKEAHTKGDTFLGRRVELECLKGLDINSTDRKTQVAYLKAVDKGIFTEKLKHRIAVCIAAAMIIGGVLAIIAASVFSGGIPLIVIMLGSAIFFLSVETIFLTYDSSYIFNKMRDLFYKESAYITELTKEPFIFPYASLV